MTAPRAALARLQAAARDRRLDALADEHGVAVLGAFGSACDDSVSAPNDLDLAFTWRRDAVGDYLALRQALVELAGTERLDLMDLERATPVARSHGVVGLPLYEHTEGLFAQVQLGALLVRMDTEWLRRLELELLAE